MFLFNIWLTKILTILLRIFRIGSGTSLPGILVEKYNPKLLTRATKNIDTLVLISGTNGKTTTRSLLSSIFQAQNQPVCSNFGGANLIRGLGSCLMNNYTWLGKIKSKIAILEVEEASLPILTKYVSANYVIFTNIFRDQLDVYGEIDKTSNYFSQSLKNLGFQTKIDTDLKTPTQKKLPKVIFNQEDPKLIEILSNFDIPELAGFGIDSEFKLKYEGKNNALPISLTTNNWIGTKIKLDNSRLSFSIKIEKKNRKVSSKLSGTYNIYNILPALIVGWDFFGTKAIDAVSNFEPVFGRSEIIQIGESKLQLFLVKNPAGFDEILKLIVQTHDTSKANLCFLINDNIADGKDVSWLWDVDFEAYLPKQKVDNLLSGGTRGLDLLLRLEYVGFKVDSRQYESDLQTLTDFLLESKSDWQICCTYTAMLEIRKILAKHTDLKQLHSNVF